MKILHICMQDGGGAGRAALRLHLGLNSLGVDSKMLVWHCRSSDNDLWKFTQPNNIFKKIINRVCNASIRCEFYAYKNTRPKGLDLFSDDRTVYDISKHPLVKEADIINLHWIARMVDYREFFSNIHNKPILWCLSDMNPFTGGCHITRGCKRYETGCGTCPQLGSRDLHDLSRRIFKRKENSYKGRNIHFVTPSKWLVDRIKRSLLFKDFKAGIIPYGLSTLVFTKRDKKYSRNLLDLPHDKTFILFGSEYKSEIKGLEYLIQALKLLKDKVDTSKVALVLFGPYNSTDILFKDIELPVYTLGYIRDESLLSCVYSAADMFVAPYLEENFPNTVLESMACGTPIVGFNVGGIPEMITPGKTGLLAEVKSIQDLAQKIEYMITHPKERQEMGDNARKLVEQEYTLQIQAERYFKLYKTILKT